MNAGILKATAIGAISCSKTLERMSRVDPVAEAVTAAKSQSLRCSSAIPSSSVIAELIIATTADEAHRLIHRVKAGLIDGRPPDRTHRSALIFTRSADVCGRGRFWDREPGALVCKSLGVDDGVIRMTSVSTGSLPASRPLRHGACRQLGRVLQSSGANACRRPCSNVHGRRHDVRGGPYAKQRPPSMRQIQRIETPSRACVHLRAAGAATLSTSAMIKSPHPDARLDPVSAGLGHHRSHAQPGSPSTRMLTSIPTRRECNHEIYLSRQQRDDTGRS
ncbi:iron-sulfur cluster assembly scaffold protein [Sinorhizobium sp. 6-70]|uniref:iron-sulfur cluster assembly scaffold protein n=1 Tax=Sinorhizobium sp. 6-70 TaxID=3049088 RepID=UPI0034DF7DFD